ncbi:MAG: UDP-N-acetylmuramoyl-L-alanine--D-glutamate ligase [Bacteroidales bacterium]|nr:UDP-N-acetylmuramoyl-L-alanine--D-glutamate ligase [Bacteroidales bacterium]
MLKRMAILGAGESGTGAAILAASKGFDVFVSDASDIKPRYRDILKKYGIAYEEGGHKVSTILSADEIIKSPGISDKTLIVQEAEKARIPVIDELEFASRYTKAKLIGISGTNGKTTTSLLTHHILKNAGLDAGLGGNVGKSFAMQLAGNDHDFWVLEISSFQLDRLYSFRANIAILTNITPDHLDRYKNFDEYAESKFRLLRNMSEGDAFIYNADDPKTLELLGKQKKLPACFPFSTYKKLEGNGAFIQDGKLIIHTNNDPFNMTLENLALQGRHNQCNSMAAGIASRILEVRKPKIKESLSDFQNVEHRLEYVANVHGIEFINDSKATNVNSTWFALESMTKTIIWIAGGKDKENDYAPLLELVKLKVKAMICLGVDNSKLRSTFADSVDTIYETTSAEEAVALAYRLGEKGDVVLLSPACASFDLFANYEERGDKFKHAVKRL